MKKSRPKRPIAITMLATAMIGTSILIISERLSHFYFYRFLEETTISLDENSINLKIVSGIVSVGFSLVPIVLAIGIWQLKSWARFLSICLFSSVMFPAIATSLGWISPPSAARLLEIPTIFDEALSLDASVQPVSRLMILNPYIALGSAIAIVILLLPAIGRAFRNHHSFTD